MNHSNKPDDIPQRTGMTSSSQERDPQALSERIMSFDLPAEARQLGEEPTRERSGHTAKTLLVHNDLRVVLISLRKGDGIKKHKANGPVTIQVCGGRVTLEVEDESIELCEGGLLALAPGIPHDVTALEDSALLLTIVLAD